MENECSKCVGCSSCEECENCEFCAENKECESCSDLSYEENKSDANELYDDISSEDEEMSKFYMVHLLFAGIFLGLIIYFVCHKSSDMGFIDKLSILVPLWIFFSGGLSSIFPDGDEKILIDGNTSSFNIFLGMILSFASLYGLGFIDFFKDSFFMNGTAVFLFVGYFISAFIATTRIIGCKLSFFGGYFKTLFTMFISMFLASFIFKIFKFIIGLF